MGNENNEYDQLADIVLMNHQILRTNIKRDVWQLVRRINILNLVRVGVLTCSWQRRKPKCFDSGISEWEEYSWQRQGVGSYTQTGEKSNKKNTLNATTRSHNTNGLCEETDLVVPAHKTNSKRSSVLWCKPGLNQKLHLLHRVQTRSTLTVAHS